MACTRFNKPNVKTLELVTGLPGSGKTTYVNNIVCQADYPIIHIDVDYFRKQLIGDWFKEEQEEYIKKQVKVMVAALFDSGNNHIILNDTRWFCNSYNRFEWVTLSKKLGVSIHCTHVTTYLDQCILNNKNRERKVPTHAIETYNNISDHPEPYEGFGEVSYISWDYIKNV